MKRCINGEGYTVVEAHLYTELFPQLKPDRPEDHQHSNWDSSTEPPLGIIGIKLLHKHEVTMSILLKSGLNRPISFTPSLVLVTVSM